MPAPLVIDTHNHYWVYGTSDLYWLTNQSPEFDVLRHTYLPSDLKPHMDAAGVHRSVIVQAAHAWKDQWEYFEMCETYPYVGGVIAWVDLTAPNVGDKLDQLATNRWFRGVRAAGEGEPDPNWLGREDVRRGIKEVTRRDLCLDLLVRTPNLPHVPTIAKENDSAKLIVDHIAKPPVKSGDISEWRKRMQALRPYDNLRIKISGLFTETPASTAASAQPAIDLVLDTFPVERLIWGSDWPVALMAAPYVDTVRETRIALQRLSTAEQTAVFGGNAQAFYGVE